jgi:flavin-dependent dehydrogenase
MNSFDVLVCGSGPAGATVALNLAPVARVLLVDRIDPNTVADKPGESLPPAARRLLSDMGLLDAFRRKNHLSCFARRAVWGNPVVEELDLLRDIDGPGWLLDRQRFDTWLRDVAMERGAIVMPRTTLQSVHFDSNRGVWETTLESAERGLERVQARVLVDATGRFANIARAVGARRTTEEAPLVCLWIAGTSWNETPATMGFTSIEAVDFGWWYTAPVPQGRRILALHTTPGVLRRHLGNADGLIALAKTASSIGTILEATGFSPNTPVQQVVAHGGTLIPAAGPAWFAAGDAAVHFDPISSPGLLNALFTGLAVAESANRVLSGHSPEKTAEEYDALIRSIYAAYRDHLTATYEQEERWPETRFWADRRISGRSYEGKSQLASTA